MCPFLGPIFFIFMQFSGTFGWIIGRCPPLGNPGFATETVCVNTLSLSLLSAHKKNKLQNMCNLWLVRVVVLLLDWRVLVHFRGLTLTFYGVGRGFRGRCQPWVEGFGSYESIVTFFDTFNFSLLQLTTTCSRPLLPTGTTCTGAAEGNWARRAVLHPRPGSTSPVWCATTRAPATTTGSAPAKGVRYEITKPFAKLLCGGEFREIGKKVSKKATRFKGGE